MAGRRVVRRQRAGTPADGVGHMSSAAELLQQARSVIRLHAPRIVGVDEALDLSRRLADHGFFDYAIAVVDVARRREKASSASWIRLGQKLAFFTSRDNQLP